MEKMETGKMSLMEGHYGRMRSNRYKLQQRHFLTGREVLIVESNKAFEIDRDFQKLGRQSLELPD